MNKQPKEVMIELNQKFNQNFNMWESLADAKLEKAFIGLHCISAIREILIKRATEQHRSICCEIYDEIFADGVSSIFLSSNAMDKPAKIVLRRVIELGIAAIYLWDMPHKAHLWDQDDQGLSFTEMLNHINSKGYISYVNNINSSQIKELIAQSRAQKIYGELSDVVHGKITTFESSIPDRFKFVEEKWNQHLVIFEEVIYMLIRSFFLRFDIEDDVYLKVPQAKKEIRS